MCYINLLLTMTLTLSVSGDIQYSSYYALLQTATVSVGEECDVELSVRYGSSIGNYTCAGRGTQQLDSRSALSTCHAIFTPAS